ncbi:MAG: peptide deformylase [Candidatus Omnitrophica bacterium]|nr:peptide deformylase [Candidatus Omnitrophota bacterium]
MRNIQDYSIVTFPSDILRKRMRKVGKVDEKIRSILSSMLYTMYKNSGIGLAAPQVGIDFNIAVVDAGDGIYKMINPVILDKKGTDITSEGCLSLPSILVTVKRAEKIKVKYIDELGREVTKSLSGITAKAVQHEIDHLTGKLIIDYLPWFKRISIGSCIKSNSKIL